ncbi:MAG: hypothetical protein ACD_19C00401G0002 [uncultured bacterium]|nr:MAG: hypothetical protein ACD_19C00401G0002 [uncultured bacterium]
MAIDPHFFFVDSIMPLFVINKIHYNIYLLYKLLKSFRFDCNYLHNYICYINSVQSCDSLKKQSAKLRTTWLIFFTDLSLLSSIPEYFGVWIQKPFVLSFSHVFAKKNGRNYQFLHQRTVQNAEQSL